MARYRPPRQEFCKRGHAYSEVGWYTWIKDGKESRACKACTAIATEKKRIRRVLARSAYKSDPNDPDVQTFRLEAARRGIILKRCA